VSITRKKNVLPEEIKKKKIRRNSSEKNIHRRRGSASGGTTFCFAVGGRHPQTGQILHGMNKDDYREPPRKSAVRAGGVGAWRLASQKRQTLRSRRGGKLGLPEGGESMKKEKKKKGKES